MGSNGVSIPLRWKIQVEGAQQAKQALQDLDTQFSKGQISVSDYAKGQRTALRDVRALNNEQRVQKEVYLASNPALNSFSKSMSTVGSVSNTLLGITNTINLAQLASVEVTGKVTAATQQLAADQRQYQIDLRDFPNDVALHEADLAKIAADQTNLSLVTRDASYQMITNWITFGSAIALTANQVVQLIPKMALALGALGSASISEGIGIVASAISNVGIAALGVLAPIAALVAALYGPLIVMNKILPGMDQLIAQIQKEFGVNYLEAILIEPFYVWYKDLQILGGQVTEWAYNLVNSFINAVNTIPKAINGLNIPGINLGTIPNVTPPGFTGNGMEAFAEEQKNTTKKTDDLVQIWTSTTTPTLLDINANSKVQTELAQQQLNSIQQSKDVITSLQTTNQAMQQQIAELAKQPQTQLTVGHYDSDTGQPLYDTVSPTAAANQISQLQNQIAINNAKIQEVGNQPALQGYLASIGMSSDSGIGSVVSGALGGASAGWTAQDVQDFINTHDYGVFTRAALRDANPNGVTGNHGNGPSDQQQIDALAAALAKNTGEDLATHPYLVKEAHDTLVRGKVIKGATGFDGIVSTATSFVAGESGAEKVSIRPVGSGSSGQMIVNNYFQIGGSVLAERDLKNLVSKFNKDGLKQRGFSL